MATKGDPLSVAGRAHDVIGQIDGADAFVRLITGAFDETAHPQLEPATVQGGSAPRDRLGELETSDPIADPALRWPLDDLQRTVGDVVPSTLARAITIMPMHDVVELRMPLPDGSRVFVLWITGRSADVCHISAQMRTAHNVYPMLDRNGLGHTELRRILADAVAALWQSGREWLA